MGAVSAFGVGAATLWESLREGHSGIRPAAPRTCRRAFAPGWRRRCRRISILPRISTSDSCRSSTAPRNSRCWRRARRSRSRGWISGVQELAPPQRRGDRHRRRRRNHPGRAESAPLRGQCHARASAVDRAPDGQRAGQPDQHGPRPARAVVRRGQRLRLEQPRHRAGGADAPRRPGRRGGSRRHRGLFQLRRAARVGGHARAGHRHLPTVQRQPSRPGAGRGRRRVRARNAGRMRSDAARRFWPNWPAWA